MPLTPSQIELLERFRPRIQGPGAGMRLWKVLTVGADALRADDLVAAGLLLRRRQGRKGFPALYMITDAGMAALPADAPPQKPIPDTVFGAVSPPRGY